MSSEILDSDSSTQKPFGVGLIEYYDNPPLTADGSICGTSTWNGSPNGDNDSDRVD